MLPVVLAAVLIASGVVASGIRDQYEYLYSLVSAQTRQRDMITLAEGLEMYYTERHAFPASLAALAATSGFEYVKSSFNLWQGYAVSPSLMDGVWTFTRAVAYSVGLNDGTTAASYLATNYCGSGGYDSAASWCGSSKGRWYRKETREQVTDQITTQRVRLNRLTQKLANFYSANQKYPDVDAANIALGANSITSLATLAGYAGGASNCSGQYQYQGVPIDCADMFDLWGGAIGYQFVSGQHVILVSETPIFNAAGNRVVIAADRA